MGLFAVITYSNDIFAKAGSSLSPSTSSIIVGLLQFFGSVVASSLIERLGRKVKINTFKDLFTNTSEILYKSSIRSFFLMCRRGYNQFRSYNKISIKMFKMLGLLC